MATLAEVIAYVETKNDPWAVRFEDHVYNRYRIKLFGLPTDPDPEKALVANVKRLHNCSWHTAAMIVSCSWGAHQVMGFNLYGLKIDARLRAPEFLASIGAQGAAFARFAEALGIADLTPEDLIANSTQLHRVAERWNGVGNVEAYSALLTAAIGRLT